MNPKNEKEWSPEAFPKPRTIPTAWDGNALMAKNAQQVSDSAANPGPESKDPADWAPEKFPKPRTYPKNWSIDD